MWLFFVSTILVAPPLVTRALSRTHRYSSWRAARPLRGSTGRVRRARPPRSQRTSLHVRALDYVHYLRRLIRRRHSGDPSVSFMWGLSWASTLGGHSFTCRACQRSPRLCSPRALGPGCHRLEESLVQEPCENTGSVAGEVGNIFLEKTFFPKEGRPRVYKSYAVGFTEGL